MIQLTDEPIVPADVIANVQADDAGAIVLFLGTTRRETDGRPTGSLDYEAYPEMARLKLTELEGEAATSLADHSVARSSIGWAIWRSAKRAWPLP